MATLRYLRLIVASLAVVGVLVFSARHDLRVMSTRVEQPSLVTDTILTRYIGQRSLVADLILTKYPDLPEQVVRQRLKGLAAATHENAIDCGENATGDTKAAVCAKSALQQNQAFYVSFRGSIAAYGLTGDRSGHVYMFTFRVYPFALLPPDRHTQILDHGYTMLTTCVAPVTLGEADDGALVCIPPVNTEESALAAVQKPIDATVRDVAENPASFNNKLVRLRGRVSGNFEYSTIEGDECNEALWFDYADTADVGPPGLVMHVSGSAIPGAEDSEGKRILPIRVELAQNLNFRRFQKLMEARVRADARDEKTAAGKYVFHCVTATFIGRIDGVSPEIHAFHKRRSPTDHADYLGFGQMGLYDAQFVMQSVGADSQLSVCPE
jgi:hypothetical protein